MKGKIILAAVCVGTYHMDGRITKTQLKSFLIATAKLQLIYNVKVALVHGISLLEKQFFSPTVSLQIL